MKIRSGFVSNSSSTSFCIIYKNVDNIDNADSDKLGIISEWYEGSIVFNLSKEMKEYLKEQIEKNNSPQYYYEIVEILYRIDEGDVEVSDDLFRAVNVSGARIYNIEGSINYPYDIKSFKDWFNGE